MYRESIEKDKAGNVWALGTAEHVSDIITQINLSKSRHAERDSWSLGWQTEKEWFGNVTLLQAINLVSNGWEEGRTKMGETLDVDNVLRQTGRYKSEGLDIGGNYPFIPAAIAGDPLCMVTHGLERAKTKPVIRIIVNNFVSSGVSASVFTTRGAAILSWVDKLESLGFRCEIMGAVLVNLSFTKGNNGINRAGYYFPIKDANEPLDIDRAAFILTHPAICRRITFALMERDTRWNAPVNHYGSPCDDMPESQAVAHSVYFPCLSSNLPDWKSDAMALAAVERAILASLQQGDAKSFAEDITA